MRLTHPQRERPNRPARATRRAWLSAALAAVGAARLFPVWAAAAQSSNDPNDAEEIARIQASAKKAGLTFASHTQTKYFLCMGDAPEVHCRDALRICEEVAEAFLPHFRGKGFKVELPARRMPVIALKDAQSYHAYFGDDPGASVGGHFDRDTNRLVVFDFRPQDAELIASAPRVNLLTLVHETTHQLTFNTGLLDRNRDVPTCICEGFATYVEMWVPKSLSGGARAKSKSSLGSRNVPRLQAYLDSRQAGESWISLATLLADDRLFETPATEQLANAEAWLLVHFLINSSTRLPRFRTYLTRIGPPAGVAQRIALAEKELGSLKQLDADLRKYAQKLTR